MKVEGANIVCYENAKIFRKGKGKNLEDQIIDLSPLKDEAQTALFKDPVRTAQ
jgi:hypothetical protein